MEESRGSACAVALGRKRSERTEMRSGYLHIRCTGLIRSGASSDTGSRTCESFCKRVPRGERGVKSRRQRGEQLTERAAFSAMASSCALVRLAQYGS